MKKKENKKSNENRKSIIILIAAVLLIVIVGIVLFLKYRTYKIEYDGVKYVCSTRKKSWHITATEEFYYGYSKEKYNSVEEALEACKQDEIAIFASDGSLEEYQEARTDCTYRDEDEEVYNFYPEDIFTYKNCTKVEE